MNQVGYESFAAKLQGDSFGYSVGEDSSSHRGYDERIFGMTRV
jgi:hypothetical protein